MEPVKAVSPLSEAGCGFVTVSNCGWDMHANQNSPRNMAALPAMAQQNKPNVVFILADNVGYGDMGPYGGGELRGFPTPRIDQLAREGLRLTQYLVEPACTPSRAALMTGQYSIRNGLSLIIVSGSPNTLSARAVTMGDLFKGAGYATAIFGKWHLGMDWPLKDGGRPPATGVGRPCIFRRPSGRSRRGCSGCR